MAPIAISQGALRTITASTFRKDLWPSRDAARAAMIKNPYYQRWDPRVFNLWIQHGLRDTPTGLQPQPGAVTLTTTKHQEVFTYLRPLYSDPRDADGSASIDRVSYPDLDPTKLAPDGAVGYNAGVDFVWHNLPSLRPTALYIVGASSHLGGAELRTLRLARTGTGVGGSGGAAHRTLSGGHLLPMEAVGATADAMAGWLSPQIRAVVRGDEEFQRRWDALSLQQKGVMEDRWKSLASSVVAATKATKL